MAGDNGNRGNGVRAAVESDGGAEKERSVRETSQPEEEYAEVVAARCVVERTHINARAAKRTEVDSRSHIDFVEEE